MLDSQRNERAYALDGLRKVLVSKGRSVLPAVLPKLTEPPVNCATLSSLAAASGEHLSRYVDQVMEALIGALADEDCSEEKLKECTIIIDEVSDDYGASLILSEILDATKDEDAGRRTAAALLTKEFVTRTEADYCDYYGAMFRDMLQYDLINCARDNLF